MNWVEREAKKTEKLVWNYKNLIVLILSIILAVFILKSDFLRISLLKLGNLEYAGVFIAVISFILVAALAWVIFYFSYEGNSYAE